MSAITDQKRVITNARCFVKTNAGCDVYSWLYSVADFAKVVAIKIVEYIRPKRISIKEYIE